MAVSSECYMQVHEEKAALQERADNLEAANQELAAALDDFIQAAEFKETVGGTMGHLQETYNRAIKRRDKAASLITGATDDTTA